MPYPLRSPLLVGALALGLAACADTPTAPTSSRSSMAPGEASFDQPAPEPSVAKYEVYYMELSIDHHLAAVLARPCPSR